MASEGLVAKGVRHGRPKGASSFWSIRSVNARRLWCLLLLLLELELLKLHLPLVLLMELPKLLLLKLLRLLELLLLMLWPLAWS